MKRIWPFAMSIGLLVACHQQQNVRREVWPPANQPKPAVAAAETPVAPPTVLDPVVVEAQHGVVHVVVLARIAEIDRRLGENIWGRPKSPLNIRSYGPGQHGQRRKSKMSDFGLQLRAKQKLKHYYGEITEKQFRKIYEEALFREKESAQIMLQAIGDGVITTDADSVIDYINPVAENLTGWRLEDAMGRNVDEVFRAFHEETCEPLENPLTGSIRRLLRQCLTSRQCSAADIARQLGIHERTLNRRLQAEGTSFRQELEQVRHAASQQLLAGTTQALAEIATSLGYADASAFSRAFKRWSGVTPAHWRAEHDGREQTGPAEVPDS